jgi:hypothetical protein
VNLVMIIKIIAKTQRCNSEEFSSAFSGSSELSGEFGDDNKNNSEDAAMQQ